MDMSRKSIPRASSSEWALTTPDDLARLYSASSSDDQPSTFAPPTTISARPRKDASTSQQSARPSPRRKAIGRRKPKREGESVFRINLPSVDMCSGQGKEKEKENEAQASEIKVKSTAVSTSSNGSKIKFTDRCTEIYKSFRMPAPFATVKMETLHVVDAAPSHSIGRLTTAANANVRLTNVNSAHAASRITLPIATGDEIAASPAYEAVHAEGKQNVASVIKGHRSPRVTDVPISPACSPNPNRQLYKPVRPSLLAHSFSWSPETSINGVQSRATPSAWQQQATSATSSLFTPATYLAGQTGEQAAPAFEEALHFSFSQPSLHVEAVDKTWAQPDSHESDYSCGNPLSETTTSSQLSPTPPTYSSEAKAEHESSGDIDVWEKLFGPEPLESNPPTELQGTHEALGFDQSSHSDLGGVISGNSTEFDDQEATDGARRLTKDMTYDELISYLKEGSATTSPIDEPYLPGTEYSTQRNISSSSVNNMELERAEASGNAESSRVFNACSDIFTSTMSRPSVATNPDISLYSEKDRSQASGASQAFQAPRRTGTAVGSDLLYLPALGPDAASAQFMPSNIGHPQGYEQDAQFSMTNSAESAGSGRRKRKDSFETQDTRPMKSARW